MVIIPDLKPTQRLHVFDLVEEAGFDVTDWVESSNDPRGPKANPKYCYEWSFIQSGKLVILNLWYSAMREEGGLIVQRGNFREDAEYHRTMTRKSSWAKRALRSDDALQIALRDNLPVRVIINDGKQRSRDDPELRPSKVTARELDPVPWTITGYDWKTGQHELTRGIFAQPCVDQFDLDLADKAEPQRTEVTSTPFIRDPAVRRRVLLRSKGKCELCGRQGFEMASGALYLETHHVIPLALGGPDKDSNVVALCADDHRRAHFALARDEIAERLKTIART
ncbi:MAG: HNH endonuclease [Sphingomonadales bacterium]|nr:MAG: HNH endonuclease [Sphingomonadales bacterium]TNF05508.1 MAG: HNH endonuclease [Sphingomonadales bacterium]